MSELPRTQQPAGLTTTHQTQPLSEHPVAVYLAGLSPSSRRTMANALDRVAQLGLGNPDATAWDVPLGAAPLSAHDGYTQRAAGAICAYHGQPDSVGFAWRTESGLEAGLDVGRRLSESGQRGECARRDGTGRSGLIGRRAGRPAGNL